MLSILAVCNHIKDTKIHQITTFLLIISFYSLLYVITSKIQKFIKSQLAFDEYIKKEGCM